jgi:hypothetical protein
MFQQSLLRNHASLGAFFGPLFRGGARTGTYRKAWLLPLAFLALASSPACAEGFSASQKAEIETAGKAEALAAAKELGADMDRLEKDAAAFPCEGR